MRRKHLDQTLNEKIERYQNNINTIAIAKITKIDNSKMMCSIKLLDMPEILGTRDEVEEIDNVPIKPLFWSGSVQSNAPINVGDKVIVIAGKDKGKEGKIIAKKGEKVFVEGVNMVKKHVKPNGQDQNGGIIDKEAAIHVSNVMMIDPKTKKRTRIAKELDKDGKKVRISSKSKSKLD